MTKQILSEQFRRMQKLAGIITENEETNDEQKLKDILKADYATFVTKLGDNINDPKFREAIKSIADENPIKTSDIAAKVKELKPTQNEIDVDKSLKFPLTNVLSATACLKGGTVSVAGKNIITGGGGKFIIDGHHRWSQVYCINPEASITAMDISNITNPVDGLKSTQLGIVGDTGKINIATVTGDNLLKMGEDELKAYVKKTITKEVMKEFVKAGKVKVNSSKDADNLSTSNLTQVASYIWKNVQQMQQNNQPVSPKAPRGIMPQTDDAPNWASDAPVPLNIKEIIWRQKNKMTKQILSEQFRRMQKLAGIITESAFNKDGEPIMTYNQSTEERNNEMNIDAQDRKNNRAERGISGKI